MQQAWLKKAVPHFIAIGIFAIISIIYCYPSLQGKVLQQSDIVHWKGMAQSTFEYKEKYGHFPLWNTNLFSGMPNYQVTMSGKYIFPNVNKVLTLGLPEPASYFFLACICFYLLVSVFGVNYFIGILSALAFAYTSYDPIIISVGHQTKMMAIAYMPGLLAGLILLFKKRYRAGIAISSLFATLEIAANHPQITYYLLLTITIITLGYIVLWIKEKQWKHTIIALSLAVLAGFIGFANNAISLLTTYEYAKYTMRGGKTVEIGENAEIKKTDTKGLDKDYAYSYSFGKGEIVTLFMPFAYGGSSGETFDENSKIVSALAEKGIPDANAVQLAGSLPKYWGGITPSTSGPVYIGAIICILAIIGLVTIKSKSRWWLFAAALFGIFMAWGQYFTAFNDILFDHLPMYNKFRAPSMALVIPQLLLPLLAALALQDMIVNSTPEELKGQFKKVLYAVGGLFVVTGLIYLFNDFSSGIDEQIIKAYTNPQNGSADLGHAIVNALIQERKSMFSAGLFRAIAFGLIVVVLLWLYTKKMMKAVPVICILLAVNTIDLLIVDSKYLNSEHYLDADNYQAENFAPNVANTAILKDKDPHYRVYSLTPDRFMDAITSYYHRSVGGYHAAKLRIYQDLIEAQLSKGMNMPVLNMLDTRYFIIPPQQNSPAPTAQRNDSALGACWFVKEVKFVNGPVEELKALDNFNPAITAFVDNSFKNVISTQPTFDSTASIKLNQYNNDTIQYTSTAATDQFAVLSEIYYPAGWNAYIDGKKVDYCKTNYVLRGIPVPAGNHKIEFIFEPASYNIGQKLVYIANILLWLALLVPLAIFIKNSTSKSSL